VRVFITGASGYLGAAATRALAGRGHTALGLARSKRAAEAVTACGGTPVPGSLRDLDLLTATAATVDAVLHLGYDPQDPAAGDIDAAAVAALLTGAPRNAPVVYGSATVVYGDTGREPIDDDPPARVPPFVQQRVDTEQRVLTASGVQGAVVRPVLVHGHGGSPPLLALLQAARFRGVSRWPDAGDNHWSTVHVDDVAALYTRMIERPAGGRAVNAASGNTLPVRRLAQAVGSAVGVPSTSAPVADLAADVGGFAGLLTLDQRFTGAATRRLLDWEPTGPDLLTDLASSAYSRSQ